jgi:NadR type nicotinamide-nucleotide adenylyltransferase
MHVVKVAITGPESTGKSMLSQALASHYSAPWAIEYARDYLNQTGGTYVLSDLVRICEGQIRLEEHAISEAEEICFFDTDMLVLKIWSQYRFGTVPIPIEQAHSIRKYDLSLLCKPDLPWTPDPFRESPDPEERMLLFNIYKSHLEDTARPFVVIDGDGARRLELAVAAVDLIIEKSRASQF